MRYRQWGDERNPKVLVCVHGLTRNGRDFDTLAAALCDDYRVLCPDVVGRGDSDWLADPAGYTYPQYCNDLASLVAASGAEQVDWLGTSMGGLIGMLLAAQPKTPVRRLIMNDVGPFLPKEAVQRIATYVGLELNFENRQTFSAYLEKIYAPFGPFTPSQWENLVESSLRVTADGAISFNYDPAIAEPLKAMPMEDVDLWSFWDQLQCPVLVFRGVNSDILLTETAGEMHQRNQQMTQIDVPHVGHAPTLMAPEHISLIGNWLTA